MTGEMRDRRLDHHRNAFGFLRLLLASLVIASHVPEIVDGDRGRELLTRAFGSITFGELAVDGFFIISGYLVSTSYLGSPSVRRYLLKRLARIYPAFVVASLICILVVAPLGGAVLRSQSPSFYVTALGRSLTLNPPDNPGAFVGSHYPDLDAAMWTIRYEFRCYLVVVLLGLAGLLHRPLVLAALAVVLIVSAAHVPDTADGLPGWMHAWLWFGSPAQMFKLTGMFLSGVIFRAIRPGIRIDARYALVACIGLAGCLFVPWLASLGVATAGAYLIFSAAALGRATLFERINNTNDISYGTYLYAWPVEKLLIASGLSSLWLLGLATWLAAMALGAISWFLVEKPALRLLRLGRSRVAAAPLSAPARTAPPA